MSVGENGEIVHKTDELARQFHERYEEIAPLYGYKTRADTKVFDPESPNGRLMRAVCLQVVGPIIAERDEAVEREIVAIESWDEERKRAIREGERVLEAREAGWKAAMQAVWDRLPMPEYANDPMTPREVAKLIEFVRSQKEAAK